MLTPASLRIQAAFKLGYFLTLINNELLDKETLFSNNQKKEILSESLSLLKIFREDYKLVINDDLYLFPNYKITRDYVDYFRGLFEFVKDKLDKRDDSLVEISFLIGGVVSIAYDDMIVNEAKNKMKLVLNHLFNISSIVGNMETVNELIDNLDSFDFDERIRSRNRIYREVTKENSSPYQLEAVDHLDWLITNKF